MTGSKQIAAGFELDRNLLGTALRRLLYGNQSPHSGFISKRELADRTWNGAVYLTGAGAILAQRRMH
jgi:hypothetical protein